MKKNLRSNELQKAKQVSGNVLTELNEAELGSISGAGEDLTADSAHLQWSVISSSH